MAKGRGALRLVTRRGRGLVEDGDLMRTGNVESHCTLPQFNPRRLIYGRLRDLNLVLTLFEFILV